MTEQSTIQQAPFPPPRAVSARARRRAWADPRVRFWWLSGLVLVGIGVVLLIANYLQWRRDARLVESGAPVNAKVMEAGGLTLATKKVAGDSPVRLEYQWQGKTYDVEAAALDGRPGDDFIVIGSDIPIRIDPRNPEIWTPRLHATPLPQQLIGGMIALPLGLILLARSALFRRRLLNLWQTGTAVPALVLGARHTAMAPRAWSVRCTGTDDDPRVFEVWLPPRSDVQEGAPLWLLLPQGGGMPVAASWFT